jgi:hypothetical protein
LRFQLYAAAFFAIPLLRWLRHQPRNAAIMMRNEARLAAARLLEVLKDDAQLKKVSFGV